MNFSMWNKWLYITQREADTAGDQLWEISTEHEIHIPVYNCKLLLFCYFVFWIPTIQDTIFILNRNIQQTVLLSCFLVDVPKKEKKHSESMLNTTLWQFIRLSIFGTNYDTFLNVFFFITTLPREAITSRTQLGLVSAKKKTIKQTWRMYINIHLLFNWDQCCTRF